MCVCARVCVCVSASRRPADSGVAKTLSACFISVSVLFVSAGCVYITPAPLLQSGYLFKHTRCSWGRRRRRQAAINLSASNHEIISQNKIKNKKKKKKKQQLIYVEQIGQEFMSHPKRGCRCGSQRLTLKRPNVCFWKICFTA